MWAKRNNSGFTIVELLIVIVVIAVLAAITIVAFNGVQDRARTSAASSSSTQAAKKIKVWQVDNEAITPTCTQFFELITGTTSGAPTGTCSFTHKDTNYQYAAGTGGAYCTTTTVVNKSYKVSESTTPTAGGCGGHGQGGVAAVTNMVINPSVEANLSGIGPTTGGTVTRETNGQATNGSYVIKVVTAGSTSNEGALMTSSLPQFGTYTGSVNAWGSGTVRTWLRFGYTDTTYTEGNFSGTYTLTAAPQRISSTTNFPDNGKTPSYLYMFVRTASAQVSTFYSDSFMINTGSLSGYGDGNTTDWVWNGTVNNSTSAGPAQ